MSGFFNGPPSYVTLPFEYRTPTLTGIQVFSIQVVTVILKYTFLSRVLKSGLSVQNSNCKNHVTKWNWYPNISQSGSTSTKSCFLFQCCECRSRSLPHQCCGHHLYHHFRQNSRVRLQVQATVPCYRHHQVKLKRFFIFRMTSYANLVICVTEGPDQAKTVVVAMSRKVTRED